MPMGSMAWGTRNGAPQNEDRSRWYGIRPGDIVTLKGPGGYAEKDLRVIALHPLDQNGCTVKKRGREFKAVCEWLEITKKVETYRGGRK